MPNNRSRSVVYCILGFIWNKMIYFFLSSSTSCVVFHQITLIFTLFFVSFQVPIEPQVAKLASLYHQVALVLLPWLLPGSEYLAHELLSTIIFSKDFIS